MKIKRFVGGSLESNGYIISNKPQGDCYIIDPGYEPKKFIEYVEHEGLNLKGIILTHHHHDHVGGVEKIRDYFGAPAMMHELDEKIYKGNIDVQLKDGDRIELDGEILKVYNTPGHTWGSICLLSEKSKAIFTGDTIFDTDLGRTDLSDGSLKAMEESCRNIIDKWTNEYTIYPGHDGSATMKQVRKYNKEFLQCLDM